MDAGERQTALDLARRGDGAALGPLLESYRPYLRVMVHSLRQERLQARLDDSDMIQDALLEAHRSFASFAGSTLEEFLAWLRQIVLRTTGHTLRGHLDVGKRDLGREQPVSGLSSFLADTGSTPSAQASRHEQAALVAEALAQLPEDMQQVVLARSLEGLPHAEIAQRLGRSEDAVRALYVRALRRLKELLKRAAGE
jgi:RNA polymerase sigma-70 factor (ECF subfamily)